MINPYDPPPDQEPKRRLPTWYDEVLLTPMGAGIVLASLAMTIAGCIAIVRWLIGWVG